MQTGGIIQFSDPIWRVIPPSNAHGKTVVEVRNVETGLPTFFLVDPKNGATELQITSASRQTQWILHTESEVVLSNYLNPQKPNLEGLEIWSLNPFMLQKKIPATEIQIADGGIHFQNSETKIPDFILFSEANNHSKVLVSNVLTAEMELYPTIITLFGATLGTVFYIIELENVVIASYSNLDCLTIKAISESEIITLFEDDFQLPLNAEIMRINGNLIAVPNPKELLILTHLTPTPIHLHTF